MAKTQTRKPSAGQVRKDIAADVTAKIIEQLRQGVVIWHKPWKSVVQLPTSLTTGKPYRGVNVFLLGFTAELAGYSSPFWGTYKQIAERGGQVRKGEKSTDVVFWKILFKETENGNGEAVTKKIPFLRSYNVFNVDQADWPEGSKKPEGDVTPSDVDPIEAAEQLAGEYLATGPSLNHGGDRAYYRPSTDSVQLPHLEAFGQAESYYSTLYHELTHSTGHESRLKRTGIAEGTFGPFGSAVYSTEELVAEMGAAILCAHAGIEQTATVEASAAYLQHWLNVLQSDDKLIISAASAAQKAVDRILGTTFESDKS
jgi:antirestriction protein ArdC